MMVDLPQFQANDFRAYETGRQRDPEFNGYRLAVRRKLGEHGKALKRQLEKQRGLSLSCRTSLNHPYKFNHGRVNAQWTYLSRSPKDKKQLQARVGPALGTDVDTHYIQTTLVVSLDSDAIEIGLRIHALAWWDGQNLKNRVADPAELNAWTDLLNDLPTGFILFMDRWKKEYVCGRLSAQDLRAYFKTYQPGEHWLNLRTRLPKDTCVEMGSEFAGVCANAVLALAPVYEFVCWTENNDWLFDADGRIRRE